MTNTAAKAPRPEAVADAAGSPLLRMSQTTPTRLWNDSATPSELSAAIGWGAVGATCNPVIALAALRSDLPRWQQRSRGSAAEPPPASESDIGGAMGRELSVEAAQLLDDAFQVPAGATGGSPSRPIRGSTAMRRRWS